MGALLDDVAGVDNEDLVGVLDGAEAVGNDEAGLALHQAPDGLLYLALGVGVHVAGCFVEDQHVGVVEHGAGNGEELFLALGDVAAVLIDDGVVALGKAQHVVVDLRGLGGGDDLLLRGIFFAVGDVVKDSALEEPGVLQYHGVILSQAFQGIISIFLIIHGDLAGVYVIEAHEQVDDGGLSGTRWTDDGDGLAGLCLEV